MKFDIHFPMIIFFLVLLQMISSDRDDRRIFLGVKFSISGFFWVGNFGNYFLALLELT